MVKPAILMVMFLYCVVSLISILLVRDREEIIFHLLLLERIWFTSLVIHSKVCTISCQHISYYIRCQSIPRKCSVQNGVLKNFIKFTGKPLGLQLH